MNEKTSNGAALGQSVPKSPKSRFRQKSQQEQTAAAKLHMEQRGEKLDNIVLHPSLSNRYVNYI